MYDVSCGYECSHCGVATQPLHGHLWLEVVYDLCEHGDGIGSGLAAEWYPCQANKVEGDDDGNRCVPCVCRLGAAAGGHELHAEFVDAEHKTMHSTPENVAGAGTMPQPAKEHGEHEVKVLTRSAVAVTAKGYVEIVLKPCGKAYVPTMPEVTDAGGLIGSVEVLWETIAKKQCKADGHIGIT